MTKYNITIGRWIGIAFALAVLAILAIAPVYMLVDDFPNGILATPFVLGFTGFALILAALFLWKTTTSIEITGHDVVLYRVIGGARRIPIGEGVTIRNLRKKPKKMLIKTGEKGAGPAQVQTYESFGSFDDYINKEQLVTDLRTMARARIHMYNRETRNYEEYHG